MLRWWKIEVKKNWFLMIKIKVEMLKLVKSIQSDKVK